ncbi:MAG: hypothetical protein H6822_16645 [Planctomycetaceae bacterium]|nr:hypothetical protein [Planctomycetales bacterium]MCB9923812.1 hypothetical protein [Planctomycetaceae bacterium]
MRTCCIQIESARHWVVHPGGPRIIDAVQNHLHLRPQALESS